MTTAEHAAQLAARGAEKIRTELTKMNASIDRARGTPDLIVTAWTGWFAEAAELVVSGLDAIPAETARRLLQVADFPVASIERHAQRAGEEPGVAKAGVPDVDLFLIGVGRRGGLPAPRGGVRTYWLDNTEPVPLTFTGTRGEEAFTRAVIQIQKRQAAGASLLHPLRTGERTVASKAGTQLLLEAAENARSVREVFLDLWRKDADGRRLLTVEEFTCMLRTYLTPYPVGGVVFGGPNAANIPGQICHDLAVGVLHGFYRETVMAERLVHLDAADCAEVLAALAWPSTLDRILEAIGASAGQILAAEPAWLAARLAADPVLAAAVQAFVELARACGSTWGTHQSQINTYLKKAAREVPEERLTDLPVPPSQGTGGHTHDQTELLMRMRHDHPVIAALRAALALLDASAKEEDAA